MTNQTSQILNVRTLIQNGVELRVLGTLRLRSGRLAVADAFECIHFFSLDVQLEPGTYDVSSCDREGASLAAVLDCRKGPVVNWTHAKTRWGTKAMVGIDSGAAAFVEESSEVFWTSDAACEKPVALVGRGFSAVTCRSASGRGAFYIWYGLNGRGDVSKIVVDFSTRV